MVYPPKLDNNVTRLVAFIMFITATLSVLFEEIHFFAILMLIDFVLRYVHPKYSPVARFGKYITSQVFKLEPVMRISPPKRFSLLVGVIFSLLMSLVYVLNFGNIIYILVALPLIFASGLLAFFDICLGCIMYDYLIKIGLFRSKSIDNFLKSG